jgi:hypothetical protein
MNLTCKDRDRIFLDGSPEQWHALEQHAATCAECAEELLAWKQLSTAAAEMRDYEGSPALWSRIESSLREQQGAAATHANRWRFVDFWAQVSHGWKISLAGAMVAVLALSSSYLYTHRATPPASVAAGNKLLRSGALAEVERTERDYMSAIDKLDAEAQPQLSADTPLMANYREKLLVLDSAISELRAQAGENPSNAHLRYQLLAMYQEKQETLQDVLETKR